MVTILDGGMGQELIARSARPPTALWGTQVMIDDPEIVRGIHADYFAAGAEIATANTYALHHDRLDRHGLGNRFAELHSLACRLAVEARDAHGAGLVAGATGPLGKSYIGDEGPAHGEARRRYDEVARAQAPHVDLFLAETVPSTARARATLDGLEGHGRPIWISVTVNDTDGTRLRSGEPVTDMLGVIEGRPVEALLVNCSFPEAVTQAVAALAGASVPIGAYANGFTRIPDAFLRIGATVDLLEKRRDLTPEAYASFAQEWRRLGATIIGGCCEVGPGHIAEVARRLKAPDAVDSAPTHA